MDFFNTKEIKFSSTSNKASKKPSGVEEILFLLKEKKEQAIAIAMVVCAGLFLYMFLGDNMTSIGELNQKITDYEQKEAPLKAYQKTQEENKAFFASAPMSLSEGSFINEIAAIASKRNVKILSYVPMSPTVAGFYQKININMNCEAGSFQQAMFFLKDVESSPLSIRVDTWSANMPSQLNNSYDSEQKIKETISMQVTFSSIHLNEKK